MTDAAMSHVPRYLLALMLWIAEGVFLVGVRFPFQFLTGFDLPVRKDWASLVWPPK